MGPQNDDNADVYLHGDRIGVFSKKGMKWDSWFHCPHCGKALFPVRADTIIHNMPFRCKACRKDMEVNIE